MKGLLMVVFVRFILKSVLSVLTLCLFAGCFRGYKNNGKEVTWNTWDEASGRTSFKVDADPVTFKSLEDGYGRDSRNVFYKGHVIAGADPQTIRSLKDGYACDDNGAYYRGNILPDSDGKSFRSLGKQYASDGGQVYCIGKVIADADPSTFCIHSRYLAEDKTDFYWLGKALKVQDKATFSVLGETDLTSTCWGKDRYNAYFLGGGIVRGIDYASFHPITGKDRMHSGYYAADKNRVYFQDKVVEGADPASFLEVDFGIGQDIHGVYEHERLTQVKDYSKVKKIGRNMYSDGQYIYDKDYLLLQGADVSTFTHLEKNWYRDKNHVWWSNRLLPSADAESFQPAGQTSIREGVESLYADDEYGCDKAHVYYKDSLLEGADPVSFWVVRFYDTDEKVAFDRHKIYGGKDSPAFRNYFKNRYGYDF